VQVTFYGVRGSTPCAGESTARYGGNTASVVITQEDQDPILLDLGTGLRYFGATCDIGVPFSGHALVTHLHWDHVQGLPFAAPMLRAGDRVSLYGPSHDGVGFPEAFDQLMRPPFFPVRACDLPATLTFTTLEPGMHDIAGAKVTALHVPHTDTTFGYRVERDGFVVAYVSDHQQPADGNHVDPDVLELCAGADLLIHDAQYTPDEFAVKSTWGHCTIDYALTVAARAGAKTLVLFHHDPAHDDEQLDALFADAVVAGEALGIPEVLSAYEGLSITLA
jgi:phosphoribosyl 1,2-cyclic phosphodiesterase